MKPRFSLLLCSLLATVAPSFSNTMEPREETCTKDTLGRLSFALQAYYTEYKMFPKGDQKAILAALTATSADGQNSRKIVFFEFRSPRARTHFWTSDAIAGDRGSSGLPIDGWGRGIVCTIDSVGAQITLLSLGRNGRDDAGHPDDILFTYAPK